MSSSIPSTPNRCRRTPPGGYQTYAFSNEEILRRSYSYSSLRGERPAKKMEAQPNHTMKGVIQMIPEQQSRRGNRTAPGGNTTIGECFNLL